MQFSDMSIGWKAHVFNMKFSTQDVWKSFLKNSQITQNTRVCSTYIWGICIGSVLKNHGSQLIVYYYLYQDNKNNIICRPTFI